MGKRLLGKRPVTLSLVGQSLSISLEGLVHITVVMVKHVKRSNLSPSPPVGYKTTVDNLQSIILTDIVAMSYGAAYARLDYQHS